MIDPNETQNQIDQQSLGNAAQRDLVNDLKGRKLWAVRIGRGCVKGILVDSDEAGLAIRERLSKAAAFMDGEQIRAAIIENGGRVVELRFCDWDCTFDEDDPDEDDEDVVIGFQPAAYDLAAIDEEAAHAVGVQMLPVQFSEPRFPFLWKIWDEAGGLDGIIDLFSGCFAPSMSDAQLAERVREPGPLQMLRLANKYRRAANIPGGRDWRRRRRDEVQANIRAELQSLPMYELEPVFAEFRTQHEVLDDDQE